MTTDNKTLADVQPGGRVQVMPSDAARALLAAQYRDDGDKAKAIRINHKSLTDSDKRALRAIEAALSAQPSPGGQDALDCIGRIEEAIEFRVPHDIYAAVHGELAELKAALAARQPVGEPVCFIHPDDADMLKEQHKALRHITTHWKKPGNDAVPVYLGSPAQAVDLGQFREAVAFWGESNAGWARTSIWGKAFQAACAARSATAQRLLALIDSQAVGK